MRLCRKRGTTMTCARLAAAVLSVGLILPSPASSAEPADSMSALREAAQRGDVAKQYDLAERYTYGQGVPKDEAEAVRWLRRAAEGGHADAQADLGFRYELGTGVPEDHAEAARWYRRAIEKGHSGAQNHLGELYVEGRGVAQDCAEAAKWFRLAAREEPRSRLHLGELHLAGCGVPADEAEALRWFLRAAEGWNGKAQRNLAGMYARGLGTRKDEAAAAKWTRRARATGQGDTTGFTLEDWVYILGLSHPTHLNKEAEQRVREAGVAAVPLLAAALETATDSWRILALVKSLESVGPKARAALPQLEAQLASRPPDDIYRPFFVAALARIEPARGRPFVAELERCALGANWQTWVRMKCLHTLDVVESPSVTTRVQLLRDEEPDLRAMAAESLDKTPSSEARGLLEAALRDTVLEVRVRAAASLLRAVPDAPAAALPALLEGVCKGDTHDSVAVANAVEKLAPEAARRAVKPLIAELRRSDPNCRAWAAVALGRIDALRAVPALGLLRQALAAEDGPLRREAAWTLGVMGPAGRDALPDLERAAAAQEDLRYPLDRARSGTLNAHRMEDLKLVALGRRDGVAVAYVVNEGGTLWEIQQGQRLLDGEVTGLDGEALGFRGQRFDESFQAVPFQARVRLFERAGPAPMTWDAQQFTGGPLSIDLDADVNAFAMLIGQFSGSERGGGRRNQRAGPLRRPQCAVGRRGEPSPGPGRFRLSAGTRSPAHRAARPAGRDAAADVGALDGPSGQSRLRRRRPARHRAPFRRHHRPSRGRAGGVLGPGHHRRARPALGRGVRHDRVHARPGLAARFVQRRTDPRRSSDRGPLKGATDMRIDLITRALAAVMVSSGIAAATAVGADVETLRRGCRAGTARDCEELAFTYVVGEEVSADKAAAIALFDQARNLYAQACERGDLSRSGCTGAGIVHEQGLPRNAARALALYQRSCDGGDAGGCFMLGGAHAGRLAPAVPRDMARAIAAYERNCDLGDSTGCTMLARLFEHQEIPEDLARLVPQDRARATTLREKGCQLGEAADCARLGEIHEQGQGGVRDLARAAAFHQKACEGKPHPIAAACVRLGALYERGEGVPLDIVRAAALFKQACDRGVSEACRRLQAGAALTPGRKESR